MSLKSMSNKIPLNAVNKSVSLGSNNSSKESVGSMMCPHPEIVNEGDVNICTECGEEVERTNNFEQEWRFYGDGDNVNSKDPARCQYRKDTTKSIEDDLKNMHLPQDIIADANNLYQKVTDGDIRRSKTRKALIFACVFHAYKNKGNPTGFEPLQDRFKLSKKVISQGLNTFGMKMNTYTPCTTPMDLIPEYIKKIGGGDSNVKEIQEIYNRIKNRSNLLNRSKPQSIASGLIYYYCTLTKRTLNLNDIKDVVKLSIATIKKIAEEVDSIMETTLYKKRKRKDVKKSDKDMTKDEVKIEEKV